MSVKLSIITVNRNNKDGLIKTIESVVTQTVFTQTCSDFEYIIIDGASSDGSKEVIEEYAMHPDYGKKITYWVSERDSGIYNAMNKGIERANGEYCLFLNSGDYLVEPTVISNSLIDICTYNADIYYGNALMKIAEKNVPWNLPQKMTLSFLYHSSICHQSTFIRRTLFLEKKYNEEYKIISDWEWFLVIYINGYQFSKINTVVAYYDMNGISATQKNEMKKERMSILDSIFEKSIQCDLESYYQLQETKWFMYMTYFKEHPLLNKMLLFIFKVIKKIFTIFLKEKKG